jgi:dihydrofolate reductase
MSKVFFDVGVSLDGYLAGPNRGPGNPLGDRGTRIHTWMFQTASFLDHIGVSGGETSPDDDLVRRVFERAGAYVMGRRMFDEGEVGWPENPPFRAPVFVLTHSAREPWPRAGGNTFHFVTDGIASALAQAGPPPAARTCGSREAPKPSGSSSKPASSMNSPCTSPRYCWAPASGCWTTSIRPASRWNNRAPAAQRASRTSTTGSSAERRIDVDACTTVTSRAKETVMSKKAAFITVHGMGKTNRTYSEEIVRELRRRLGAMSDGLHLGKVYYQDILQPNEERVWAHVAHRVKWDELRKSCYSASPTPRDSLVVTLRQLLS